MSARGRSGVGSATTVMALGTAASRVLGQGRLIMLVWVIGVTGVASDAFDTANSLPNTLNNLLVSGALSAFLVPQVVRAYKRNAGQEYVDRLLSLGFLILAAMTVVLTAAVPLLVQLYGHGGGDPRRISLAVAFGYWTMPQIFFYGMYALLGQVLNARESFGPFMWAPAVNNVVAMATMGVFAWRYAAWGSNAPEVWTSAQVALLAGGATLGIVAQALILLPAMRHAGVRFRFRWGWRGMGLRTAGQVVGWTFASLAIGQISVIVVGQIASLTRDTAGQGVAGRAAYSNAFMIFMLPHSLVTLSLITALFPRLSAQAADHARLAVARTFSQTARVVGLFTVLAGTLAMVLAQPLVRAVLPSLSTHDVPVVARVVMAFMVGLPAFGVWSASQRVYQAYQDTRALVPMAVGMAAVVLLGAGGVWLLLPAHLWVFGAALAMSASYMLAAAMSLVGLKNRIGTIGGSSLLRAYLRATIGVAVAAVVGWVALAGLHALGLGDVDSVVRFGRAGAWVVAVVTCVVVGALMTVVYGGMLRMLRVRELDVLLERVRPMVSRLSRR